VEGWRRSIGGWWSRSEVRPSLPPSLPTLLLSLSPSPACPPRRACHSDTHISLRPRKHILTHPPIPPSLPPCLPRQFRLLPAPRRRHGPPSPASRALQAARLLSLLPPAAAAAATAAAAGREARREGGREGWEVPAWVFEIRGGEREGGRGEGCVGGEGGRKWGRCGMPRG